MAGERGANAVLFDITEDRSAAEQVPRDSRVFQERGLDGGRSGSWGSSRNQTALLGLYSLQLQQPLGLTKPVVLIWGSDAAKLMEFVYKNRKAYVWIELKEPPAGVSTSGLSLASATTSTLSTSPPGNPLVQLQPLATCLAVSIGVSPTL